MILSYFSGIIAVLIGIFPWSISLNYLYSNAYDYNKEVVAPILSAIEARDNAAVDTFFNMLTPAAKADTPNARTKITRLLSLIQGDIVETDVRYLDDYGHHVRSLCGSTDNYSTIFIRTTESRYLLGFVYRITDWPRQKGIGIRRLMITCVTAENESPARSAWAMDADSFITDKTFFLETGHDSWTMGVRTLHNVLGNYRDDAIFVVGLNTKSTQDRNVRCHVSSNPYGAFTVKIWLVPEGSAPPTGGTVPPDHIAGQDKNGSRTGEFWQFKKPAGRYYLYMESDQTDMTFDVRIDTKI